jgi:competence protein ComEA
MRSRRSSHDEVQAIARRRLELLRAELAAMAEEPTPDPPAAAVVTVPDATLDRASGVPATASDAQPGPALSPGRHARRSVGITARLGGWMHDRLPPTLQGRVSLGPGHVAVVSLLVAVACALTAWWVVRADGTTTVVPTAAAPLSAPGAPGALGAAPGLADPSVPALVTPDAGPDPPGAAAAAAVTETVVVDVTGRVRRPGIVELPAGSRVVDAVEAAGGARRGVDLSSVNLARALVDGEQVVVGVPAPGGVAASAASAPGAPRPGAAALVSLNSATQTQLEELPGIGPVTATAILQWRSDHGPFTAVDELLEVSGIGDATLAEIAPFVTL